jgi:hypothetical protein
MEISPFRNFMGTPPLSGSQPDFFSPTSGTLPICVRLRILARKISRKIK